MRVRSQQVVQRQVVLFTTPQSGSTSCAKHPESNLVARVSRAAVHHQHLVKRWVTTGRDQLQHAFRERVAAAQRHGRPSRACPVQRVRAAGCVKLEQAAARVLAAAPALLVPARHHGGHVLFQFFNKTTRLLFINTH
jgi:hypothetical protein